MSFPATEELREFHRFLTEKLSNGNVDSSPEEALDEWRQQHPEGTTSAEEIAAIQEALTDRAKGDRGTPFAEFDREFRIRHQLPEQP